MEKKATGNEKYFFFEIVTIHLIVNIKLIFLPLKSVYLCIFVYVMITMVTAIIWNMKTLKRRTLNVVIDRLSIGIIVASSQYTSQLWEVINASAK